MCLMVQVHTGEPAGLRRDALLSTAVIVCFWAQGIHFGPGLRRDNFVHPSQLLKHDWRAPLLLPLCSMVRQVGVCWGAVWLLQG